MSFSFSSSLSPALLRFALGALFVWAALSKFIEPSAFLAALKAADWLPLVASSVLAIFIPAIELALGAALLIGWKVRWAATGSVLLVSAFTVFLLIEMARGNGDCGCFGQLHGPLSVLTGGPGAIVRNLILLAVALWIASRVKSPGPLSLDRLFERACALEQREIREGLRR